MEITIDVTSTNLKTGESRPTNTARVTMVAIENGKPTPVPPLIMESREEKLRFLEGKVRRELRKRQIAERERLFARFQTLDEAQLDKIIADENAFLPLFDTQSS